MINLQFCTCLFLLNYLLYKITNKNKIYLLYLILNIPFCFIHGNYTFFTKIIFIIMILLFSILPLLLCALTNIIAKKNGYEILSENGIIKKNGILYKGKLHSFYIFMSTCGWLSLFTVPCIFLIPYITIL